MSDLVEQFDSVIGELTSSQGVAIPNRGFRVSLDCRTCGRDIFGFNGMIGPKNIDLILDVIRSGITGHHCKASDIAMEER